MIFQKNNIANLLTLCEACHTKIHKETGTHKKVKTSKGLQLELLRLTSTEFPRSPSPSASDRSKLICK